MAAANDILIQLRWSDLDANLHIRHSVYYDWGAMSRLDFLSSHGLTMAFMSQHGFGPIIFREEARFLKEIRMGDEVRINMTLARAKKDFSRWTIQHELKKADKLAALITVDGAWLDTRERKLFSPPPEVHAVFSQMAQGSGFEWSE